jgi:hypothetical protein
MNLDHTLNFYKSTVHVRKVPLRIPRNAATLYSLLLMLKWRLLRLPLPAEIYYNSTKENLALVDK